MSGKGLAITGCAAALLAFVCIGCASTGLELYSLTGAVHKGLIIVNIFAVLLAIVSAIVAIVILLAFAFDEAEL